MRALAARAPIGSLQTRWPAASSNRAAANPAMGTRRVVRICPVLPDRQWPPPHLERRAEAPGRPRGRMLASAKARRTHYLQQAILLARDRLAQPGLSFTTEFIGQSI